MRQRQIISEESPDAQRKRDQLIDPPSTNSLYTALKERIWDIEGEQLSSSYVGGVKTCIRQYYTWCVRAGYPSELENITRHSIQEWILYLRNEKKLSPVSIRSLYANMRSFLRWAQRRNFITTDPTIGLKAPKAPEIFKPILDVDDINKIVTRVEASKHEWKDRNAAIILLFFDTGLRCGEMAKIKWQDIDWDEKSIRVLGKNNKEAHVFFGNRTFAAMRKYAAGQTARLGPFWKGRYGPITRAGVYLAVKEAFRDADIPEGMGVHTLRHSFATHLAKQGIDKGDLKTLGRWETWTMVEHYSKAANEERAKEAHRKFSLLDSKKRGG